MSKRDLRLKKLAIALAEVALIAALITGIVMLVNNCAMAAQEHDWDVCYSMANANVNWEGAGYNGVYGR